MLPVLGICLLAVGLSSHALYLVLPHKYIIANGIQNSDSTWLKTLKARFDLDTSRMTSFAVKLLLMAFAFEAIGTVLFFVDEYIA